MFEYKIDSSNQIQNSQAGYEKVSAFFIIYTLMNRYYIYLTVIGEQVMVSFMIRQASIVAVYPVKDTPYFGLKYL